MSERTRKPKTSIAGEKLTPNFNSHTSLALKRYWYWVGVLLECPTEWIDCAGINFPKHNALLREEDGGRAARKVPVPVYGGLQEIDAIQFKRLMNALPRVVVRITGGEEKSSTPEMVGPGINMGMPYQRPRRGHVVTIPSEEMIEHAKRTGRPIRQYISRENDVPGARYMYARLCEDQQNPVRGTGIPHPLEQTGLHWPDELPE